MWKSAERLSVTKKARQVLQKLANGRNTAQKVVLRDKIVLRAAEGLSNNALAKELGTSRPTVLLWRERFQHAGVDGLLRDAPRPGRRKKISDRKVEAIVNATLHTTPPAATHWSVRSMAKAQKVSPSTVHRIWRAYGLQPHRTETFKLSRDPEFVSKLRDIVGLYLNPPDKALVLSVDEKSQIQALDRTQPVLPLRPGIPARQTHDYVRHGTTSLFAALNVLDGTVIGQCMHRHRHCEFIRFLENIERSTPRRKQIHLILDNYGTHKHPKVKEWFGAHPRYHLHFTPTSASWLNMVERFFSEITTKQIRRGTFRSVPELERAIYRYLREHNENPVPFVWTAPAAKIIRKLKRCKELLETGH